MTRSISYFQGTSICKVVNVPSSSTAKVGARALSPVLHMEPVEATHSLGSHTAVDHVAVAHCSDELSTSVLEEENPELWFRGLATNARDREQNVERQPELKAEPCPGHIGKTLVACPQF